MRPPLTLCHRDLKLDNIFFTNKKKSGQPGQAIFIDWTMCEPCRGVRDVAYFMSHSISSSLRRKLEQNGSLKRSVLSCILF